MRATRLVAIVDDDPDVRGSLDSLLRSAGLVARGFASAEDLLDTRDEADFACIVTDLHMPGLTGLELQAELARRGWTVPLIVVTAYPTRAARLQALGRGAAAFLTKPVDPDQLLEAIEGAMS